ncbi:MAG: RNA polymerase sigma factor [Vicinamibacterales bacterium]
MTADPPNSQASPDDLIERCLAGDQAAWEDIVGRHWRRIFNIAYQFVGKHDEAEDLTQDIFLKVFRSLASYDRRANFQTWLVSVSRNLCIDHYRSVRKERQVMDRTTDPTESGVASNDAGPIATLEQRDQRALLREALDQLPLSLRTAVILRDLRELSYQEIAQQLELPEGTVKSRINRGRLELARQVRLLQQRTRSSSPRPDARQSGVLE